MVIMEGDIRKCPFSGCFGTVKSYLSDIMGSIQCGSKEVLFIKKAVHFPENVPHDLKQYLSVGTLVNFNAEYLKVNNDDADSLVATLVWYGNKPEVYVSCPLSEYIITTESNDSEHTMDSSKMSKKGAPIKYLSSKEGPFAKIDIISDYMLPVLDHSFVTVDFHYENFQPHVKLRNYTVTNVSGEVVFYLSNSLGIMSFKIENKLQYAFFSHDSIISLCSKNLKNIPLVSLLPLNESYHVDVEVFVHNFKPQFFRVNAIKIDEFTISHLFPLDQGATVSNNQSHSKFTSPVENIQVIREGFLKLKGVVSHVSSNEGIIDYDILGNVCKIKFDKKNVYHPQCFDFVLEDYMPVGTTVIFTALNCKVTNKNDVIAMAGLVQVDNKSDKFKSVTPNGLFTGKNETFFISQTFSSGIITGHTSDGVVIKCKIASVNCMVCLHKNHPEICGKQDNSKFSEYFPVGENVHFNAKVICCGKYIKVALSDLLLYKEKIGIVSSVTSKTLTATVHINEHQRSVEAKITHFVKSDYNCLDEKRDDLTCFISIGDTVRVEVMKQAGSPGHVKWVPYRVERISPSNEAQNGILSDRDENIQLSLMQENKKNDESVETVALYKSEQRQSLPSRQKITDVKAEARRLSLDTTVKITNNEQLENRKDTNHVSVDNTVISPMMKQNVDKAGQLSNNLPNVETFHKNNPLENEDSLSEALIYSVGEDDVSFTYSSSLLSFHCKNISLFGVSLLKYDLRDIFQKGDILKFTLSCDTEKLCVGFDVEEEQNREQLKTQLCQFCDERNIKDYIKSLLVYDFDCL